MTAKRARRAVAREPWLLASAVLLGVAFLCLLWRRLLLQGLVPVDGNMIAVTYPNWRLARSLWTQPRLPLWNPFRGMGAPHAADPITSALYPPLLLLSGLADFHDFLSVWVVGHTLLAAFFTGALAWRWYRNPRAALAAALLGGCNGFFTARVIFQHHFAAAAWLPAALFFQETSSEFGVGLCLALQWLAGYPPFSLLSALLLLGLAAQQGRAGLIRLLRGSLWAAGLAAVQWIPFLELLRLSGRGVILGAASAAQFSLPPAQLLKELFLPQWYGLAPSLAGDPAMVCVYAGLAATGLALLGIGAGSRERRLGCALGVFCLLSLGSYLPGYDRLTPLHVFRYPANWLFLVAAVTPLLCAAGLARLRDAQLQWAAVVLVAADLLGFSQYARTAWADPRFLSEPPALAREAAALPPPQRLYHSEPLLRAWGRGTLNTPEDYALMRDFLAPSYGMAFGLQDITNYQTLRLKSAESYRARLEAAGPRSPLLDWTGASLILTLASEKAPLSRGNIRVWRNPKAAPRVFFADSPRRVELRDYRPGRVLAATRDAAAGTVVLSEADYPGWRVLLDGRETEHVRWADFFVAVPVPPGRHELLFEFSPRSFWIGLWITLLTLAASVARFWPSLRRR